MMADRRIKSNTNNHRQWGGGSHKNRPTTSTNNNNTINNNNPSHQSRPDCSSPQSPNGQWTKKSPLSAATTNNNRQNGRKVAANDCVRRIVQEEGRSARNLITWSVPLQEEDRSRRRDRREPKPTPKPDQRKPETLTSDNRKDRKDSRARYWAFLFDNLERAVDEIYKTCEADESEVQCKEAIMMLEHSSKDFKSLIERLRVIREFETAKTRPTSLAWELRKTSPGKAVSPVVPKRLVVAATAKRILDMSKPVVRETAAGGDTDQSKERNVRTILGKPVVHQINTGGDSGKVVTSPKLGSYADRVRGIRPPLVAEVEEVEEVPEVAEVKVKEDDQSSVGSGEGRGERWAERVTSPDHDEEGWETVHNGRTRRHRHKLNGKASSTESLNSNNSRRGRPSPSGETRPSPTVETRPSPTVEVRPRSGEVRLSPSGELRPFPSVRPRDAQETKATVPTSPVDVVVETTATPGGENDPGAAASVDGRTGGDDDMAVMNGVEESAESGGLETGGSGGLETGGYGGLETAGSGGLETAGSGGLETAGSGGLEEASGDLDEDEEINELYDDYRKMQAKLYDELEVMNQALQEQQALEMNNNIEDAVTEQMNKEDQDGAPLDGAGAPTEEAGTQTAAPQTAVLTWDNLVEAYHANQSLSWGEMVELEERTPGRSVQMHEKLSSPSRKPCPKELSKKHEEKQLRAQQLRDKLMADKAERLRELARKVEIVNQIKEELGEQRRDTIDQKMRAAEQKRNLELRKRMQKAHDEETKANEIAFINSLEAQNKKHEIETKHQESQARLLDIAEERQRRNEEKAAKEAAVEERRKALEADRLARIQELQERRKQRESEFEQRQQEKEKERIENARAKEKDREERIAAIKAQHEAQIEELRVKIQEKQDESARRHSENLAQIREKAFEMTILRHSTEDDSDAPKLTPYDKKKLCMVCNVLLPSEVHLSSHLRGRKHQQSMIATSSVKNMTRKDIEEFNLEHIKDAPSDRPDLQLKNDTERRKALKKRCKKLRQRMSARGAEYENSLISGQQNNSENKQKLQKLVKDINKVIQVQGSGPWGQDRVSGLDRALGEVGRVLDKGCRGDQESFCAAGGVTSICRILMSLNDVPAAQLLPDKSLSLCASVLRRVCHQSLDNCRYMLLSNKLGVLVDFLAARFSLLPADVPDGNPNSATKNIQDPVATALIQALISILHKLADLTDNNDLHNRKNDIVSYLVSVGVIDRVRVIFLYIRQPIENNAKASDFLDACLQLVHASVVLLVKAHSVFDGPKQEDHTLIIQTLNSTELCGVVSLLYSVLLHTGSNAKRDEAPLELPDRTIQTVTNGIQLLNAIARMSLTTFQSVLGEEGTWLEFRHICSYLLWYCAHFTSENLLHEVIISVGYFTVLNNDNQQFIQSGQSPTVLQQLCGLPFQYFSNARLTDILFPTLVACSYQNQSNRHILENELSCALLANFIEENGHGCKKDPANMTSPVKLCNRFPVSEFEQAIKYFKV